MLRRIEGWGATGLRGMDWDDGLALARKALGWFAVAGAMALLCGVRPAGLPAPFAMAFMAAVLAAGWSASAALAGCMAAALSGGLRGFDLSLALGAVAVLGGSVARDALGPGLRRWLESDGRGAALRRVLASLKRRTAIGPEPMRQARSPNRRDAAACAALAGLGALLPGLILAGGSIWPAAVPVAAGSVAAVAAAPFFLAATAVRPWRRWLNPEERAGVFLLIMLLTAGLARLSGPLALCVGGALAQLLYPAGALAGVGLGGALAAASGDPRLLALIALGGATAQLCDGLTRPARAASACGTMLAAGLLMNLPPASLAGAGLSSLLVAPMPPSWAGVFSRLSRPAPPACDPQRLAVRLRRDAARRLRALGAAFGELAEGYLAPVTLPDEQALLQRLRGRLCEGCPGYEGCWAGERDRGARLLCELIARAVALSGEAPLFEDGVPPDITRRCRRGRLIPERIQEELEDFARARREELKRGAENRLISAQFLQARQLLDGLAERQARPLKVRERQAARAAAALERAGLETASVTALGGGSVELVAALKAGRWTPEQARLASARLSATFGRRYAPAGPLGREARFVRRPRLRARTGAVCASREAGRPSGDSHLICMLDDERLLVLISDGMGSGDAAARESAVAVRLLGRFLRAGASSGLAVETVNALLLNRGGEDMFATVDMLVLNLSSGEAELTKLAACPTLIARAGRVRRVEGGRLPLGILEQVQPGRFRARLQPGDALMMVSDGVLDAAGPEALEALLTRADGDMPRLARRALAAAERGCEGGHRDDMTAVCLGVELTS